MSDPLKPLASTATLPASSVSQAPTTPAPLRRWPRIAILGADGQVGWELQRSLQALGEVLPMNREMAPLDDQQRLLAALDAAKPHIVVNAAAYTAVDKAEIEREAAFIINANAPEALAKWAKSRQAMLVHYSTDYVFDGSGAHFRAEDAATGPLSVYGASKLIGEQAIASTGCAHLIFRTSWVYAARGGNFAKTMLRLARERDELKVVNDQWGAPTGADLIADVTAQAVGQLLRPFQAQNQQYSAQNTDLSAKSAVCLISTALSSYENSSVCDAISFGSFDASRLQSGLFHLVAGGETNWHAYAAHVIARARARPAGQIRVAVERVLGTPTSAYPTPAQRPLNSRLCTTRLQSAFGLHLPAWQTGVDRLIDSLVD